MQETGRIHGLLKKDLLPNGAPRPLMIINCRPYAWITKEKDITKCRLTLAFQVPSLTKLKFVVRELSIIFNCNQSVCKMKKMATTKYKTTKKGMEIS